MNWHEIHDDYMAPVKTYLRVVGSVLRRIGKVDTQMKG